MATWSVINASDLPIVSQLLDLLQQVEPVLEGMRIAADTAGDVIGALSAILANLTDPTAALRAAIDAVIHALIENRIGVLLIQPTLQVNYPSGLDGFVRILERSLNDPSDPYRPQFAAGDESTGVVFLATAPSFAELVTIAELFQRLFGDRWQHLIDLARSLPGAIAPVRRVQGSGIVTALVDDADDHSVFIDSTKAVTDRPSLRLLNAHRITWVSGRNAGLESLIESFEPSTGTITLSPSMPAAIKVGDAFVTFHERPAQPPDWRSVRVIDVFPPLAAVTGLLARVRDSIGPQTRALGILAEIARMLQRKAFLIEQIAAQIQELIGVLAALGELTNISMLPVPPQLFGNAGFVEAIRDAENPPQVDDDAYVMGIVLYGGTGVTSALSAILGPVL